MNIENKSFEKAHNWVRNSVTLKVVTITIMVLLLLIPTEMVKSIIGERETLNYAATNEVGSKWAGPQQLNGPILTIPVVYEVVNADQKSELVKYWHILPEELKIDGTIQPEKLRRGIYEVVVYKSKCSFTGKFDLDKSIDRNSLKEIRYDQAFLTLGITDLRGIKDEIILNWNDEKLKVKPGSTLSDLIYSGVTIDLPDLSDNLQNKIDFDFALNLQGSQSMSFVPLGNTTEVNLKSNWPSPSFDGNFLPDSREVSAIGF
ncbi:MAG: inner membrane CreD family protein, partial [Bacteroidales bacterium]